MSKYAVSIGLESVSYQYSANIALSCDLFDLIFLQVIGGNAELGLEATGEIRM